MITLIEILIAIVAIIFVGLLLYDFYETGKLQKAKEEEDRKKREEEKMAKQREQEELQKTREDEYLAVFNKRFGSYGAKTIDILIGKDKLELCNHFLVFGDGNILVVNNDEIPFSKLIGYNVQDNSETIATSSIASYTSTTSTSTGSMLGRAVVGGVLLGGVGALAGATTAKQNTTTTPTGKTTTTTKTRHNYVIFINVDDLNNHTRKLNIGDDAEKLNNITNVLNIILQRNSK
jgi:hypothetical protein